MLKNKIFGLVLVVFVVLAPVFTAEQARASADVPMDSLIKVEGQDTVYYYAADGKRYVFPNEKIYKTWFADFSDVIEVTPEQADAILIGGNVHYRPGVVMVKIQTSPTVYVVGQNGVLRSVGSAAKARKMYGDNWNKLIDDIPAGFFTNYTVGAALESDDDYDPDEEADNTPTINRNHRIKQSIRAKVAETVRCQFNAMANRWEDGNPGIGQDVRECVHERNRVRKEAKTQIKNTWKQWKNSWKNNGDDDTRAPVISEVSVEPGVDYAVVSWLTDEEADGLIRYATTSEAVASSTMAASHDTLMADHALDLPNLEADTTYYYQIVSADAYDNERTSDVYSFKTLLTDATAPVISSVLATPGTTSAVISWTTNELSDGLVKYATSTLGTASSVSSKTSGSYVLSHSFNLEGLTATTTYYFILQSADISGNKATTTESVFKTLE